MIIHGFETAENLHESDSSILYRAKKPDGTANVILKILKGDHPSPQRLARFRREFEIAKLFQSSRILKVFRQEPLTNTLVSIVEDFGDHSLIRSAGKRGAAKALEQAAHKLKGCMGNFGAGRASLAAERLEIMGRTGEVIQIEEALADLEHEVTRLRDALTVCIEGPHLVIGMQKEPTSGDQIGK